MTRRPVSRRGRLAITCDYDIVGDAMADRLHAAEDPATAFAAEVAARLQVTSGVFADGAIALTGWTVFSEPEAIRQADVVLRAGAAEFAGFNRGDVERNGNPPREVLGDGYRIVYTWRYWVVVEQADGGEPWTKGDLLLLPGLNPDGYLVLGFKVNPATGRTQTVLERMDGKSDR